MPSLKEARDRLAKDLAGELIPPPWPHQVETFKFGIDRDRLFDASDPGTGKTRAHIDIAVERMARGTESGVLVVCPKSLMAAAWRNDFLKFAPDTSVSLAYADNREAAFDTPAQIYIINTDGVKFLEDKGKRWMKKRFGNHPGLIIDESTAYKHQQSQRSRAMRRVAKHFDLRTMMSGTPITSSVMDIWHQMFLLDGGETFGTSSVRFRNQTQINVGSMRAKWVDIDGVEDIVAVAMSPFTVRHQFEDVMDVPENESHEVYIDLSPKHQRLYDQLKEEALIELQDATISAVNEAVLRNKLLQVASGAVYDEVGDYKVLDTQRFELVGDLLYEREASVVFFNWKHQRDLLCKEFKKRGYSHEVIDGSVPDRKREEIVRRFQAGDIKVLAMHPATGAHGLTLTHGRTTIWMSPVDHPDWVKQGKHRVYRGGQEKQTENIAILSTGTLEQRVFNQTHRKYKRLVNLLDVLTD